MEKFYLEHQKSGEQLSIKEWYKRCLDNNDYAKEHFEVRYPMIENGLIHKDNFYDKEAVGMWKYFDILPLNSKESIITSGEGNVDLERWHFLEEIGKKYFGINLKVYAHRFDNHASTGTWKDLSGSTVASSLKEMNIKNFVVPSTGNIATAFSRYLSDANINFYAFIPKNSSKMQEAEIGCFGQKVFRVNGDYQLTKTMAVNFANRNNFLLAAGTFDPRRVEAKKTMAFEWMRIMNELPDAYIQGLSGGTGPIGIEKGCREMIQLGMAEKQPKLLLVQSSNCAPMAHGYQKASKNNFTGDWLNDYPVYENPDTEITTLATGNPGAFPYLANLVNKSDGFINEFDESKVIDIIRIISFYKAVRVGPAAAIGIGGYFEALKNKQLSEGESVVINIGEGIRRSPDFMIRMIEEDQMISSVEECSNFDRNEIKVKIDSLIEGIIG